MRYFFVCEICRKDSRPVPKRAEISAKLAQWLFWHNARFSLYKGKEKIAVYETAAKIQAGEGK